MCFLFRSRPTNVGANANPASTILADKRTGLAVVRNGWVARSENSNGRNGKEQTYGEREERDFKFLHVFPSLGSLEVVSVNRIADPSLEYKELHKLRSGSEAFRLIDFEGASR